MPASLLFVANYTHLRCKLLFLYTLKFKIKLHCIFVCKSMNESYALFISSCHQSASVSVSTSQCIPASRLSTVSFANCSRTKCNITDLSCYASFIVHKCQDPVTVDLSVVTGTQFSTDGLIKRRLCHQISGHTCKHK